jgi:hypothetical protein
MDESKEPKFRIENAGRLARFLGRCDRAGGTSLLGLASAGRAEAAETPAADRMPPIPADKWTDARKLPKLLPAAQGTGRTVHSIAAESGIHEPPATSANIFAIKATRIGNQRVHLFVDCAPLDTAV